MQGALGTCLLPQLAAIEMPEAGYLFCPTDMVYPSGSRELSGD
jgi:hypothetical protein